MSILSAIDVTKAFGGVTALSRCSVKMESGQVIGLVGPNGAGKTTLFNILSGLIAPSSGAVEIQGRSIIGMRPDQIVALGAAKTFQVARGFGSLSVLENLLVADSSQRDLSVWRAFANFPGRLGTHRALVRQAIDVLAFLKLIDLKDMAASHLSTGQKKLLDIGRALMLSPKIILLDEPLAGVNPKLAEQIAERIDDLRRSGMSVALVEHRVEFVRELCDYVYVLSEGKILMEGRPNNVFSHTEVISTFLGGGAA
ncbi:MAG: ABC transporter ATP-binding protein [Rhizobiales bacterium]|nr:ABC transporter ATP-binding protein [Hyphomicrobiales bacterium]